MILAQAGHMGPCARPETARQIQYVVIDFINPDIHMAVDAIVRHTEIKTAGDENAVSK